MKLTNPSDDELERAFATEVCGWMWRKERGGAWFDKSDDLNPDNWVRIVNGDGGDIALRGWPNWTRSADAVLPWLQKQPNVTIRLQPDNWVRITNQHPASSAPGGVIGEATDKDNLPRAAVIALLRAHGVEVVFTSPN